MDLLNFGYWLFSTLVQATAALFAVVGVFIIFKIQILHQRQNHLTDAAKQIYISIMGIHADPRVGNYREVTVYLPEEIATKLKELIIRKQYEFEHNKTLPENDDIIEKVKQEISTLEAKLKPLEQLNKSLLGIKKKGKNSLIGIGILFGWSLCLLFITRFIGGLPILILGLITVGFTISIVIHLAQIIIESLK